MATAVRMAAMAVLPIAARPCKGRPWTLRRRRGRETAREKSPPGPDLCFPLPWRPTSAPDAWPEGRSGRGATTSLALGSPADDELPPETGRGATYPQAPPPNAYKSKGAEDGTLQLHLLPPEGLAAGRRGLGGTMTTWAQPRAPKDDEVAGLPAALPTSWSHGSDCAPPPPHVTRLVVPQDRGKARQIHHCIPRQIHHWSL
ncbi:uncharacterized protein LOC125426174 isoform X1 [Sphaerodactylus townsendi]|uniref:uncharacterized protein LOC125426174 isoform X1 n=1 Tax=Sphaerodactylus townsendi TaxID=933632 RepID=UPI002026F2E8|nr:uncharacterized protein LOC125426174 isoform X1 [Sphaerodactylus townsendi]